MTHTPERGVSFSHRHAEWLGLDPDTLYRDLLDDLGVRHVRLSVYWDEVAPAPDQIDFEPLRRWLDPLQERHARALVTVGLKAQRWPEYYPPDWLVRDNPMPHRARLDDHPRAVAHLLLMLERVTAFLADYDAIDAWQVENEPWITSIRGTVGWRFSADLLAREIAVVRESDPRRRPIVVNHSTQSRFDRRAYQGAPLADVLAENIYTRKPTGRSWPRYVNTYALGPFAPPLRNLAAFLRRHRRRFWITELQAEPWESHDVKSAPPSAIGSISPDRLQANLRLAERVGTTRVYLWGAEWWRYAAERSGDPRYWILARRLFQSPAPTNR
jgi:hypothetical protein